MSLFGKFVTPRQLPSHLSFTRGKNTKWVQIRRCSTSLKARSAISRDMHVLKRTYTSSSSHNEGKWSLAVPNCKKALFPGAKSDTCCDEEIMKGTATSTVSRHGEYVTRCSGRKISLSKYRNGAMCYIISEYNTYGIRIEVTRDCHVVSLQSTRLVCDFVEIHMKSQTDVHKTTINMKCSSYLLCSSPFVRSQNVHPSEHIQLKKNPHMKSTYFSQST